MDDKNYNHVSFLIGLSLAISSSIFIGSSFIIKKLALKKINALGNTRPSAGGYSYLRQWMWWLGFLTMGIGEAANLVAYAFAPAALVTPLGALSVLVAAVLSGKFLNEKLNYVGKVIISTVLIGFTQSQFYSGSPTVITVDSHLEIGCFLCILGSVIFVVHSPKHEEIQQFSELSTKLTDHMFLTYILTIIVMTFIVKIIFVPRFGNTSIIVYLLICSAIGSLTVVFCKGVALGIRDSINGNTENFSGFIFWSLLVLSIICIVIQMNYLNKALDIFNTNIVTPVYYVMFTVLVIIASGILFREWENMETYDILGCLCGFFILILAVFTLNTFKDLSLTFKDFNLSSRHSIFMGP